jgi:hypothetical protein
MKKMMCTLMVMVCAGMAFAQAKAPAAAEPAPQSGERKNSIGTDLFPLFRGLINSGDGSMFFCTTVNYERLVAPHYSIGGNLDLYYGSIAYTYGSGYGSKSGKYSAYYISLAAEGRYYIQSESLEKAFLGTTLGFNMCSIDGSVDPAGFIGLITSLKVGYKVVTSKNIYIEPAMSYVLSKAQKDFDFSVGGMSVTVTDIATFSTPHGWEGGLRIGYVF